MRASFDLSFSCLSAPCSVFGDEQLSIVSFDHHFACDVNESMRDEKRPYREHGAVTRRVAEVDPF